MPAVSGAGMNWPLKDACSSISFSWRRPSSSVMAIYICMHVGQPRQTEGNTYYTNTITIDITQFISANEGILAEWILYNYYACISVLLSILLH